MNKFGFSRDFARRMLVLSCIVGLVLSLALPLTYLFLSFKDRENQAIIRGEILARSLEQDVRLNPELWYFDVPKFVQIVGSLNANEGVAGVRIYNEHKSMIYEQQLQKPPTIKFTVQTPIRYNNLTYGFVTLEYGLHQLVNSLSLILAAFFLLGIVTAAFIYKYPVAIVKKMEENIVKVLRELESSNQRLELLSTIDGKTQLYNATYLVEQIKREIEQAVGTNQPLALLMLDIDYFKKYNDIFGHVQGDKILASLGIVMCQHVRPSDVVGRFGGEEFLIILPNCNEFQAVEIAEQQRASIEESHFFGEERQPGGTLTISIGVATLGPGMTVEQFITKADGALYAAKEAGRNQVCIASGDRQTTSNGTTLLRVGDIAFASGSIVELIQKLEHQALSQVQSPHVATLLAFLKALESGKGQTAEHSLHVNKIAMLIGKEMNLSEKEMLQLNWGTILHDIGKLAIGDSILLKEGPLTDKEFELMKTHASIGYELLKNNDYLDAATKIVLYHHECWDGSGYPFGLKCTAIPLLTRICSLADAVAAMSEDRTYRKALSHTAIIKEVQRKSGTQFDEKVVQCFLQLAEGCPSRLWLRSPKIN